MKARYVFFLSLNVEAPLPQWCIQLHVILNHVIMASDCTLESGPWFNIRMSSHQYRKSHCGDKMVIRSSYIHNGISYAGKITSLYWFMPWLLVNVCMAYYGTIVSLILNSLWPGDAICQQISWSLLAQVMACCLMVPSHYLSQCWLAIS